MGRRVLILVLVLAVALFVYLGYNSYDARREGANGDVFSRDSGNGRDSGGGKMNSGAADGSSRAGQTIVYPAQQPAAPAQDATPGPSNSDMQASRDGAPASDTISPNPPNGMVFSGTGKYQLYRQGNLTWRLNTDTGQSCILFATDAEWKKPKVYRAGCGNR